ILAINLDITGLLMFESSLKPLLSTAEAAEEKEPERIVQSVGELLDELIEQSTRLVGKPVALMTKEDKIRAIQFLNKNGAFLITKSGDKISKYYGISKYTLYSYIDAES
ncbi:MAG: helix-turn-helix domain-containing protein, partial [Butyricicoccus pullicaecorum]|nr:helix-turn-helix domain-containing protein [Butyricicoccus pullicaecorum]